MATEDHSPIKNRSFGDMIGSRPIIRCSGEDDRFVFTMVDDA